MNIHNVYRPFLRHFRQSRIRALYQEFGISASTRVLDVGGSEEFWDIAAAAGLGIPQVTIVNLRGANDAPRSIRWVIGDARRLPFADKTFDVAISNSLIEHVGGWEDQVAAAAEIARVAAAYVVQTPDPRFPIEPHLLAPFIHWLPMQLSKKLVRNFTLWGWVTRPDKARAHAALDELHPLTPKQMQLLFSGARLNKERFLGMSKSIVMTRLPS